LGLRAPTPASSTRHGQSATRPRVPCAFGRVELPLDRVVQAPRKRGPHQNTTTSSCQGKSQSAAAVRRKLAMARPGHLLGARRSCAAVCNIMERPLSRLGGSLALPSFPVITVIPAYYRHSRLLSSFPPIIVIPAYYRHSRAGGNPGAPPHRCPVGPE